MRKIIHVDMDAFYASVEQRDNPTLIGLPLVVAKEDGRSVVCAASYEARQYGVKSAMPVFKATELCRDLVIVPPRIEYYRSVSYKIRSIFSQVTDIIEPLSLDEAYLDVTQNKLSQLSARFVAEYILSSIYKEVGLTASAGVSYNKFLAKVASKVNKPNGLFVIPPSSGLKFIHTMPIESFFGVGQVTADKFKSLGVQTGADLALLDRSWFVQHFGKSGLFFYNISRGVDNRPVVNDKLPQSVASEQTFVKNIDGMKEVFDCLEHIFSTAYDRLLSSLEIPRRVALKIKYDDFSVATRSKTLSSPTTDKDLLRQTLISLCQPEDLLERKIRLLGVSFSEFDDSDLPVQSKIDF